MITLISFVLKTFHDVTPIYLSKMSDLSALLTDYTYIRLVYPGERRQFSKADKAYHTFCSFIRYIQIILTNVLSLIYIYIYIYESDN